MYKNKNNNNNEIFIYEVNKQQHLFYPASDV